MAQPESMEFSPLAKPLRKFNLKLRAFKRVLDLTRSKGGRELKELSNLIL